MGFDHDAELLPRLNASHTGRQTNGHKLLLPIGRPRRIRKDGSLVTCRLGANDDFAAAYNDVFGRQGNVVALTARRTTLQDSWFRAEDSEYVCRRVTRDKLDPSSANRFSQTRNAVVGPLSSGPRVRLVILCAVRLVSEALAELLVNAGELDVVGLAETFIEARDHIRAASAEVALVDSLASRGP
jgi:hypothetical protein